MTHYFQFVKKIEASPEVEVDLDPDEGPFWVRDADISPPTLRRYASPSLREDGEVETGSSFDARSIEIELSIRAGTLADDQAAAISELVKVLDRRGGAWLKWQAEGMPEPRFYRTRRASPQVIDDINDLAPERTVKLSLSADAAGWGLPVTQTVTITNNPTSGTHKMQAVLDDIEGDLATPLHLTFPTGDAAHRVAFASEAIIGGGREVLLLDDFNRPNNATAVGDPIIGPSPAVRDGVAGIINHKLYFPTDSASITSIAWDLGTADGWFETVVPVFVSGNDNQAMYLRSSSDENGFYFGNTTAYRVSAGTFTSKAVYSAALLPGDGLGVHVEGNAFTVYRRADNEGEWVQVGTFTDSTHNTVDQHGLAVFSTSGDQARFSSIKALALAEEAPRSAPYYKALSTGTVHADPPGAATVTDSADATMVSGTARIIAGATFDNLVIPTAALVQTWDDLPIGDYRVFVRTRAIADDLTLLFFNRPPRDGVAFTLLEAAAALPVSASTGHDWHDLGIVAMPGGAPIPDAVFDLDELATATALWNVGVYGGNCKLDAVVLVPAGRPNTLARHGSVTFDALHTDKIVTLDGINNRHYALGESIALAGEVTYVHPTELAGRLPVALPGAANILTFFATAADASATRIDDDKALTTEVDIFYHPRWAYERPTA